MSYPGFSYEVGLVPAEKTANNVVAVRRLHYVDTLKRVLICTSVYKLQASLSERIVVDGHVCHTALNFGGRAKKTRQSSNVT